MSPLERYATETQEHVRYLPPGPTGKRRPERSRGDRTYGIASAVVVTAQELTALTLDGLPSVDAGQAMHWRRISAKLDKIDRNSLTAAHAFAWLVLQAIDPWQPC